MKIYLAERYGRSWSYKAIVIADDEECALKLIRPSRTFTDFTELGVANDDQQAHTVIEDGWSA